MKYLLLLFFCLPAHAQMKDWTVMVFLNGNNDLDPEGNANIRQMEAVGSDQTKNIIVQWASLTARTTKRLYIERSRDPSRVTSPVVQELPHPDMGRADALYDFIAWTHANYPAKHYFIVVWDHGNGWHFAPGPHLTDISWDEKSGHQITTEEMAATLDKAARLIGHKIDLFGADA